MQTGPLDGKKACNMHAAGECIPFVSVYSEDESRANTSGNKKDLQKSTHDHVFSMGTQFRIHFQV